MGQPQRCGGGGGRGGGGGAGYATKFYTGKHHLVP